MPRLLHLLEQRAKLRKQASGVECVRAGWATLGPDGRGAQYGQGDSPHEKTCRFVGVVKGDDKEKRRPEVKDVRVVVKRVVVLWEGEGSEQRRGKAGKLYTVYIIISY